MDGSTTWCESEVDRVIPLDAVASLPRVRTATGNDLAAIIAKNVFEEHVVPALSEPTPEAFLEASRLQIRGFANKMVAVTVQLARTPDLALGDDSVDEETDWGTEEDWRLAIEYLKQAEAAAKRLLSDHRFMENHLTGAALAGFGGMVVTAAWFVTCGLALKHEFVIPSEEMGECVRQCALDTARRAYHLLRDAEVAYSQPTAAEAGYVRSVIAAMAA